MFKFHNPKDIVTLFHKAGSPASVRAATLLKQVSANATEPATEDQASDHTAQTNAKRQRAEFDLDITEKPPTTDQLRTILEYVGQNKISSVIQGASNENEALKKFKESAENFQRPVLVDWNNGKALASDVKESEILKLLEQTTST
ncbi:hypothetical protein SLS62_006916 [Diatrype stigma]|uniref:DUF1687-domain-containing protein n=1 Tax=Diatrype stigma TaxID=117547 RepID=A0AAN9UPV1_9PEZI